MRNITAKVVTQMLPTKAPAPFPGKHPVRILVQRYGVVTNKRGHRVYALRNIYQGKPCTLVIQNALESLTRGDSLFVREYDTKGPVITYQWAATGRGEFAAAYPGGISATFAYYHPFGTTNDPQTMWKRQQLHEGKKPWKFYADRVGSIPAEQKEIIKQWLNLKK